MKLLQRAAEKKKITKTGPKLTCQVNSQGPKSGAERFQCFQSFKKSRININVYFPPQLTDRIWRVFFFFFFKKDILKIMKGDLKKKLFSETITK